MDDITTMYEGHRDNIIDEYSLMRILRGCPYVVGCDDVREFRHNNGIGWDIYIKMELLTSLKNAFPEKNTDEFVIKVATDICKALEFCHNKNIIHRDIKPQNIFVSEYGDFKLGDFGVAKSVEKTMGATVIGTYRSLERLFK